MSNSLADRCPVTATPAAAPAVAAAHFARLLEVETDCWDVFHARQRPPVNFVLLDVRTPEAFARGHVPGATNLPHRQITADALAAYPPDALFVVYCTGVFCNGADRAALRLAQLGRAVKKMIGGMSGWRESGYPVEVG
jgi:rhodanese-related sulfurtransferase